MHGERTNGGAVSATSLSTFEIFTELALEDRSRIAELMRSRVYQKGEFVISTDNPQTDVYFLISGKVRACAFSHTGKQIYFDELAPGMMFGEFAAIDKGERSSDCIAVEDSQLAVLSSEHFLEIIRVYPEVQEAVLKRLVRMVRNQMQRVYEFTTYNVKQRIRLELLRMATAVRSVKIPIVIEDPPTHADLAARVSTHREAVTRELNHLESLGLITWGPGQYLIHDLPGLSELARS